MGCGRPVAIGKEAAGAINGGSLRSCDRKRPKRDLQGAIRLITRPGADRLTVVCPPGQDTLGEFHSGIASGKGYETLLPTYKTKKRWNGKVKQLDRAAFPGLCFLPVRRLKASSNTGYARRDFGGGSRPGAVSGK